MEVKFVEIVMKMLTALADQQAEPAYNERDMFLTTDLLGALLIMMIDGITSSTVVSMREALHSEWIIQLIAVIYTLGYMDAANPAEYERMAEMAKEFHQLADDVIALHMGKSMLRGDYED